MSAVELQPVNSSNVEAVGYDAAARELHVKFRRGGYYVYGGITDIVHKAMLEAESIGSFMRTAVIPSASKVERVSA